MDFSCLSHGRAELDCKDCRKEAASELIRLIREMDSKKKATKGTNTIQALRLGMEALNLHRQIQNV